MLLEQLIHYFTSNGVVIFLESQNSEHCWARKSYLAASPKAILKARGKDIYLNQGGHEEHTVGDPWDALQAFQEERKDWLFGYLGYDLKNALERLTSGNKDLVQAPDLYFMVPEFLLEIDNKTRDYRVLKGKIPILSDVEGNSITSSENFDLGDLAFQTNKAAYLEKIRKAQHSIHEGEFYEINLSHQLKGKFRGSSWGLYKRMREIGSVPFGAYIKDEDIAICSQSPERFLRKEGTTILSQPIKGTAPRSEDHEEDMSFKNRLSLSPKERAENLMIVDLVRNDLSKIASKGSVTVPQLFSIESFGTVHQMVSTIKAEAKEGNPVAIIKACFPMGSMTGAPKISAMKAIEELEDYRRGIYSGAIGYITPHADFDFNVVIRTAIINHHNIFYSTGGAITSESVAIEEWEETLIKVRALIETNLHPQR